MKKLLLTFAVFLWAGLQIALAQSRPVKGQILDENGEGVPGASVQVKGSSTGTISDVDGNFVLDVPDDENTLVITALGFGTKEVAAGDGANSVTIQMSSSAQLLGETIVTALNIKKEKRSLGYSVTEVSGDDIERSGERNAIQSLAGKVAGVNVTSSSGTPGASTKIRLRGNSTFTAGNDPLVIVDGIPIDNSSSQPTAGDYPFNMNLTGVNESNRALDINPDDIESVSVLKGPAAATLYGQRGANGAIIITTKKGSYGKGTGLGITFNSSLEFNQVSKLPEIQTSYGQGNGGEYLEGSTPNSWGPRLDTTDLKTYDNFRNFFQTGAGFNNTLSLNGGNETAIFRASIGNYNTKGMIPNSSLNRTNVTLNGESKLSSWLTVGGSASYSYTEGKRIQNGSNVAGAMLSLFRMPATYDIRENYYDEETGATENYFVAYDNPLFTAYRNPYQDYTNRIMGNVYFNASITKELTLSYKLGSDAYGTQSRQVYDINSLGNDASDGTGQMNKSSTNYMQVYSDLLLKYSKRFNDFSLDAMVGHNYWYQETRYNFMRGYNAMAPGVYNLGLYSNLYASNSDGFERSQAIFAEVNLGYKSFIYLTLTGRNEWHSAFGSDGKSFFYPKADLAWVFTEHIDRNDILSYGKLRLAISKAGVGPQIYADRNYYAQPFLTDGFTNGNSFPYLGQVGYMPSNVSNPGNLRPEVKIGKEIGLDLRFWKNKINFAGTYYHQISQDLLVLRPVAPSSGYVAEYVNIGKMLNHGLELELDFNVYRNKDWDINIGVNWAKNISEVLELAEGVDEISIESGFVSIGSYAIVGEPYGVFYGSTWARDEQDRILVDNDGYPYLDDISKNLGDPNPDWLMGINGDFSWKGLSLTMLWDIRKGGDIWNGTWARMNNVGIAKPTEARDQEYLVEGVYDEDSENPGQPNTTKISGEDYFRYVMGDLGATENAIQDGGWIRLREIGLSYRHIFKNTDSGNPFKYIELGFTGRNLFLSTKYKGVDPETSLTGGGSNIGGWDYFNNPGSKSYIINLKFGL